LATAGGPDGCGSPEKAGELESHDLVKSRVTKLLSGFDVSHLNLLVQQGKDKGDISLQVLSC